MFIWLLIGCVSALAPTPKCNVPVVEGHLHLTSMHQSNAVQTCDFSIDGPTTYIEIERYHGRKPDKNAWMNFTFVGEPDITVSIGLNRIWAGDMHYSIPTTTKLEFSMWLKVEMQDNFLSVSYAPPGSSYFGQIVRQQQDAAEYHIMAKASTGTGTEQVIQNVQTSEPTLVPSVKRKSIIALEKRVADIEKDLRQLYSKNEKHDDLHDRHFKLHQTQYKHIGSINLDEHVDGVRQRVNVWASITLCIVLVGVYVSWRTYQRHKKNQRWTL